MAAQITITKVADDGAGEDDIHSYEVVTDEGDDQLALADFVQAGTVSADGSAEYVFNDPEGVAGWRYAAYARDQGGARRGTASTIVTVPAS